MLKTPKFWTKKNVFSYALLPFGLLYLCGFYIIRFFTKPHKVSKKILCIGNLIAGGSGKTPTAIAIGKILHELNVHFCFLSRGYMGDGSTFLQLRKHDHYKAAHVGDEPLLLLSTAPTYVATDRLFGAKQIEQISPVQMIVLDDGMQNNSLHRDYTILVVDGKIGFGNDFPIPAGPMRELLSTGLKKADLVIVIGEMEEKIRQKLSGKTIVKANVVPLNIEKFSGKKLMAFTGLAYPQKFFSYLREKGLQIVETRDFPDHYNYQPHELEELYQTAKEKNLTLITTRKDWVKFPHLFQEKIHHLDIELEFEDKALVIRELLKIL